MLSSILFSLRGSLCLSTLFSPSLYRSAAPWSKPPPEQAFPATGVIGSGGICPLLAVPDLAFPVVLHHRPGSPKRCRQARPLPRLRLRGDARTALPRARLSLGRSRVPSSANPHRQIQPLPSPSAPPTRPTGLGEHCTIPRPEHLLFDWLSLEPPLATGEAIRGRLGSSSSPPARPVFPFTSGCRFGAGRWGGTRFPRSGRSLVLVYLGFGFLPAGSRRGRCRWME